MNIEEALYAYLSSYANLTAIVGTRIYPLILPQSPILPAITYSKVSGPRVNSKDGASGLAYPRFQFSCWAKSYGQAKQVAEQIRLALDTFPSGRAFIENEQDIYEPDTGIHHIPIDFIIWHTEVV